MLCALVLAAAAGPAAHAQLTIDMTRPNFEPVPIAVVDFQGDPVGSQMATVIRNNLQTSGLFRSIAPGSFIEPNLGASAQPRFPDWRNIGAAGLVVGSVTNVGGNIKVDFRLWDVIQSNQAAGSASPANRPTGGGWRTSSRTRSTSASPGRRATSIPAWPMSRRPARSTTAPSASP
jgi:TolB protein